MAEQINVNDFKTGSTFIYDKNVYQLIDASHSKSGRGQAHVKCKVKNLFTGTTTILTFTGGERVDKAFVQKKAFQFLYVDGQDASFMDNETFEQITLPIAHLKEELKYMAEGLEVMVTRYAGKFLGVELPKNVNLVVTHTTDAVRGDTVTAASKKATVSTGYELDVPQFINNNQEIIISTQTGKYNGKV